VDDLTLHALWARQLTLLQALQQRGHASFTKVSISKVDTGKSILPKPWKKWLKSARQHPQWSPINKSSQPLQADKKQLLIDEVIQKLVTIGESK